MYVWIECYPSSEKEEPAPIDSDQVKVYYREILILKQRILPGGERGVY